MIHQAKLTKKKYSIEYRVWKDTNFFQGWFQGIIPVWSNWYPHSDYDDIVTLKKVHLSLEQTRPYLKNKKEYRVIINE